MQSSEKDTPHLQNVSHDLASIFRFGKGTREDLTLLVSLEVAFFAN